MEHLHKLQKEIDSLLTHLPNREEVQDRLSKLDSVFPFNEYEYAICTLLAMDILTLEKYHELRDNYIKKRNPYLYVFEISAPRTFGERWAQDHLKELIPELEKPSEEIDEHYEQQYNFYLDGICIEVKASRAVAANTGGPLYVKALSSDSTKDFWMNFQQVKPSCCDVFVLIAVWRDVIRYWVLSSREVETNPHYSKWQHRGNVGEGQLHIRQDNIHDFENYEKKSNELKDAIRPAFKRQSEK